MRAQQAKQHDQHEPKGRSVREQKTVVSRTEEGLSSGLLGMTPGATSSAEIEIPSHAAAEIEKSERQAQRCREPRPPDPARCRAVCLTEWGYPHRHVVRDRACG